MDAMFLASESRESMMHVGGLLIFDPPQNAQPGFLRDLADELRRSPEVHAPWSLKLNHPDFLSHPRQVWIEDDDFDMEYHLRRSALPSPGDERELGILVSRLHSTQIDFHRPPWELHFIEGLEGGRFAMYIKLHHALVDGYTAMRMLAASLSSGPDDANAPMFFAMPPRPRAPRPDRGAPTLGAVLRMARDQLGTSRNVGRAVLNVARSVAKRDKALLAPMQAPKTILNGRVGRARRFATQQYGLDRLKQLGKRFGGTLNDVVLALCGAALRRLLLDLDALPGKPLIAMLPVNVRPKDDPGGGNAVGSILASLATDVADPRRRFEAIIASTTAAKDQLRGMQKAAIIQYSALLMTPLALQNMTGTAGRTRPAFNVVISNVPGPREPLYFRGARLRANYPLSIPFHGYGLNITVNGYAGTLNFGFTACRDALPHMQRLAVYAGEALVELEEAAPDQEGPS
jgi:WS/DGAT/MGAT family acyltransferase